MKRTIITFLILLTVLGLKAQKAKDYAVVDDIIRQIPDSLTQTTASIANFINSKFTTQSEKSRAVFIWVANNIQYDIENMFAIDFYQKKELIISKTLRTRKGICMHYAEVFSDISNKAGLKTFVISGYTKQSEFVDYIPHAWCVGLVDTTWCLYDPTWGSGVIFNNKFIRKINNDYYRARPEKLIKSHMSFDPLWQLLNYPITSQEFYEGKFAINKNKAFFNFNDSIVAYENLTEEEQLMAIANRIELNGVKNSMIFDKLHHIKVELENFKIREINEKHSAAINYYNESIRLFNVFIDYRNKQFTPKKEDAEIKQMIDDVELELNKSLNKLNEIKNADAQTSGQMQLLYKNINEMFAKIDEQKEFVTKYCKTSKLLRKTLFYKRN